VIEIKRRIGPYGYLMTSSRKQSRIVAPSCLSLQCLREPGPQTGASIDLACCSSQAEMLAWLVAHEAVLVDEPAHHQERR
jgi:hypothetical protein